MLLEDDKRIKKLIVEVMDDLIEHCLGPDGIFYYKELPSLQRTAPTPHALEALTYAFRVTDDQRYLEIAARQFAAMVASPAGKGGGPKRIDKSGAVVPTGTSRFSFSPVRPPPAACWIGMTIRSQVTPNTGAVRELERPAEGPAAPVFAVFVQGAGDVTGDSMVETDGISTLIVFRCWLPTRRTS